MTKKSLEGLIAKSVAALEEPNLRLIAIRAHSPEQADRDAQEQDYPNIILPCVRALAQIKRDFPEDFKRLINDYGKSHNRGEDFKRYLPCFWNFMDRPECDQEGTLVATITPKTPALFWDYELRDQEDNILFFTNTRHKTNPDPCNSPLGIDIRERGIKCRLATRSKNLPIDLMIRFTMNQPDEAQFTASRITAHSDIHWEKTCWYGDRLAPHTTGYRRYVGHYKNPWPNQEIKLYPSNHNKPSDRAEDHCLSVTKSMSYNAACNEQLRVALTTNYVVEHKHNSWHDYGGKVIEYSRFQFHPGTHARSSVQVNYGVDNTPAHPENLAESSLEQQLVEFINNTPDKIHAESTLERLFNFTDPLFDRKYQIDLLVKP